MSTFEKFICQYSGIRNHIVVLAISVLSASFYLVYSYELNVPQWDDFSLSLLLLWMKGNTDGILTAMDILFSQFFEHKLVVYRLVALLDYSLFGQLDFKHLAYFGNLINVVLLVLLCHLIKNDCRKYFVAMPVILLFLVSFQWVGQAWRNGAGGTYVLGFAGLAFYFVAHESNSSFCRSILAIVLSTLAMFTTANGLLVTPVILAYFIYLKNHRLIALWGVIILAQWSFYFLYDYEKIPYKSLPLAIIDKVCFFVVSSGSALSFGNLTVASALGLILVVSIGYLTIKRYVNENPAVYLFLVFNVLNTASIAWGRSRFGLDTAISERYLYISLITFMLTYIGVQETIFKRSERTGTCFVQAMSILFLSIGLYSCYTGTSAMGQEKSLRIQTLSRWLTAGDGLRYKWTLESDFVLSMLLKSGLYVIPQSVINETHHSNEARNDDLCSMKNDGMFQVVYDVIKIPHGNTQTKMIRVEGIISRETDTSKSIFIVLNGASGENLYYTSKIVGLKNLELAELWENAGRRRFVALVPTDNLKMGGYRIGICDGRQIVYNESQSLVADAFGAGLWRIHWIKRLIVEERHGLIAYAQSLSSLLFDN